MYFFKSLNLDMGKRCSDGQSQEYRSEYTKQGDLDLLCIIAEKDLDMPVRVEIENIAARRFMILIFTILGVIQSLSILGVIL